MPRAVAALVVLCAVAGCSANRASERGDSAGSGSGTLSPTECSANQMIEQAAAQPQSYRIQPGDDLLVNFYLDPEFNEDVVVRPDGQITLQLVGSVQAAGLTPDQLAQNLEQAYSRELRSPTITVHVKSMPGRRIYVAGQVPHPGSFALQPGMTALQAVADAGGFTDNSDRASVILIRRDACGQAAGERLDLAKAITDPDHNGEEDAHLAPLDIVYVPSSTIAHVDLFVKQYIQGLLPVQPEPYIALPAP